MGKIRTLLVFLFIFGAVSFIPLLYALASSPAIQSTTWGQSFLIWFADMESTIANTVDTTDAGPGWEIWIVALVVFLIPLCVYQVVHAYDESRSIRRRTMKVEGVIQESSLQEKLSEYSTVYNVSITFEFPVEGKVFTKTETLSDLWSNDLGEHQERLEQHHPGAKIPIQYEPGNIENYAFKKLDEPSNKWAFLAVLFVGGLYFLFSWLTGVFLMLFLKNFPSMDLGSQISTGIFAAVIFIAYILFSTWIYIKGMANPGQSLHVFE